MMKKEIKTGWIGMIFLFSLAIIVCLISHSSLIEFLAVLGIVSILMSIMWWAIIMNQIIDI